MGARDLGTLRPQANRYCKEPRQQAMKCLDTSEKEDSTTCTSLLKQASKCEQVLEKAFRHVNMAGCAREIQAATICEVEWCEDLQNNEKGAQEACQKECLGVRKALDSCVKQHVATFFQRHGLEDNGTIKLQ